MVQEVSKVTIRAAVIRDADAVFALLSQFVVSYVAEREPFDRMFPRLVASPDANVLVAVQEGAVIGYALALRVPTFYANGELWHLQELMVDADHRCRGIGRTLLDRVVVDAHFQGAVEVVVPSRRAGGFYLRNGFVESGMTYKRRLGG